MIKVTVDQVMELDPCEGYTRELVEALWQGRESLSLEEILELNIPISDKLGVLTQLVPTAISAQWAQHCADKAKEYNTDDAAAKHATRSADDTARPDDTDDWAARYATAYRAAKYATRAADDAARSAAYDADWAARSAIRSAAAVARSDDAGARSDAAMAARSAADSTEAAAMAADATADWAAYYTGKDYEETLKELLNKLIEMSEEIDD